MKNMNKILAVSILAITAVSSANAKIVSESLLTSTPGTYTNTNTVEVAIADAKAAGTAAAALAGQKVGSVTTGSANGTISVDNSDVAVKGLKSAAYTESSAYATAAQGTLADNAVPNTRKVAGHALSADVTLSKGDVGLGNVDDTADLDKPISTLTQEALDEKGTLFSEIEGNLYANMKTGYAEMTDSYPSVATVGTWIQDKTNTLGGEIGGKQDKLVSSGDGANVNYTGSGSVIKDISATGGVVSVTRGSIANADISSSAAISTAKSAIPTGWTNTESAAALAAGDSVSVALGKLEKKVDSKQASGSYETAGTASSLIDALDVSTSGGTGNVVTAVTQSNGKITVTKTAGSIKDGDVASDAAISTAKSAIPTGWTNTESAAALAAGDSVSVALGKLEKKVDSKQASGSYETAGTASSLIGALDVSTATGDGHVVTSVTQSDGKITVAKTAGSITNADISSSAQIAPSKIATDSSNRFVSDTDKSGWSGKQAALGGTAGQLVATTSNAGTVAYTPSVPSEIPSTPNKDGMFVLTAKVVNSTPTFYWEDIGR